MFVRLKLWLAGAVALLAAFVAAWMAGKREGHQAARSGALRDYAKTRQEMDDADAAMGDDPAAARRWLHERGKRDGDL